MDAGEIMKESVELRKKQQENKSHVNHFGYYREKPTSNGNYEHLRSEKK